MERREISERIMRDVLLKLDISVDMLRLIFRDQGSIDLDRKAYVAYTSEASAIIVTPDEMVDMAMDKKSDILVTLFFWLIEVDGDIFNCCEMCSVEGVQKHWVVKVNGTDGWLSGNNIPESFIAYFSDRILDVDRRLARGSVDNVIRVDPDRWVAGSTNSKYGAN